MKECKKKKRKRNIMARATAFELDSNKGRLLSVLHHRLSPTRNLLSSLLLILSRHLVFKLKSVQYAFHTA